MQSHFLVKPTYSVEVVFRCVVVGVVTKKNVKRQDAGKLC